MAFLLFGLLEPVVQMFAGGGIATGDSRLWVAPRHSISDMLPVRYHQQVQQVEGVDIAAHLTWFGGTYIDASTSSTFTRWAISVKEFMQINSQLKLPKKHLQTFINTPSGAIVGRSIAERYNMKIGDKIPLTADIWHNQDGSQWEFDLVGIYDSDRTDTARFFVNYEFFDEYRTVGKGIVSNVVFTLDDIEQAATIGTNIDAMFANSDMETRTLSEQEYMLNQIKQLGNIGLIVRAIMGAVLFTILLLTGNTMSQAVRERTSELAVLKTLGFQNPNIVLIILAESMVLALMSAGMGLGFAAYLLQFSETVIPQAAALGLAMDSVALGMLLALALALVSGLPPAIRATRLNIVDALQR
jgi:putative ABC transport system permease protein